jgi:signal transduction histidine kinase
MERKGGLVSRGLFHDMEGICSGARASAAVAMSQVGGTRKTPRPELSDVVNALDRLMRHIARGRKAFEADQDFRYEQVNRPELCESELVCLFDDSDSLRQTREWRVRVLERTSRGVLRVPCDRFALERALLNLVSNAKRAVANRGPDLLVKRVHLLLDTVKLDGLTYARIRVADDGPGLRAEAFRTIFEGRFSTRGDRHGLGTQVVAEQVRKHHGFIEVVSTPGLGSVIGLVIPAPRRIPTLKAHTSSGWLAPYAERARREALVSRRDLDSMLAEDAVLRQWYGSQRKET